MTAFVYDHKIHLADDLRILAQIVSYTLSQSIFFFFGKYCPFV